MRHFITILFIFTACVRAQDSDPNLTAFAEKYWAAICSRNPEKIYELYDPEVFKQLTPQESNFIKQSWMKGYLKNADRQGDSFEITSSVLPADSAPFPNWRWAAKPQYQLQIATFKNVAIGKEGIMNIIDLVIKRSDRFYIIRPVPPKDTLQKQMNKNTGEQGAAANP